MCFGILLGHILQSPSANVLPTLPFHVLRALFSSTPLTTDDGVLLRRMALEIGAIHLILACLSALSHHAPRNPNANTSVSEVWPIMYSHSYSDINGDLQLTSCCLTPRRPFEEVKTCLASEM